MKKSELVFTVNILYFMCQNITFEISSLLNKDFQTDLYYSIIHRSIARGFIMLKPTKLFGELRDI